MKILVACEFSGVVRDAFRDRGHDAWSCDLEPCEDSSDYHFMRSVEHIIPLGWDLMIAHPPCTYLTVTANKWYKDQPPRPSGALVGAARRAAREDAVMFFMQFAETTIPRYCIENPVGVMSTRWRKPDQIISPTMFGHPEPKKTCLWLQGLPLLKPTKIVEPEYTVTKSGKRIPTWYHMPSQSKERQKDRERTFIGVAEAMAEQWG